MSFSYMSWRASSLRLAAILMAAIFTLSCAVADFEDIPQQNQEVEEEADSGAEDDLGGVALDTTEEAEEDTGLPEEIDTGSGEPEPDTGTGEPLVADCESEEDGVCIASTESCGDLDPWPHEEADENFGCDELNAGDICCVPPRKTFCSDLLEGECVTDADSCPSSQAEFKGGPSDCGSYLCCYTPKPACVSGVCVTSGTECMSNDPPYYNWNTLFECPPSALVCCIGS